MAGTREGGLKSAQTLKSKKGNDYFVELGSRAGTYGTTGGFASEKVGKDGLTGLQRSKIQGSLAGKKSGYMRRLKRQLDEELKRIEDKQYA